jgi:autoinducer 2-degrading protein
MAKLAIVATLKTAPGKREEYLPHLKAHGERCRATEPGTLQFEIMLPHDDPDTILLYELYESPEAFQVHWNGPSIKQTQQETQGLVVSLKGTRCNLVE